MEPQIIRNTVSIALMAGLLAVVVSGCYYDNEEDLYENYYENNQCDTTSVTFADDIMPLVQGNCAISGCHVAGGTGNGIFENYEGVKEKVDNGSLRQRVLVDRNMPPTEPLTECQLDIIDAWLNAGAPDN